jgi:hypothetical protein
MPRFKLNLKLYTEYFTKIYRGNLWEDRPERRTLGIRDKQILYLKANKKCQACGKEIDFTEMQVGHKIAASKGGRATLKNSVCLCWRCNNLQGTDSWSTFLRKQGIRPESAKTKEILKGLSIQKLKFLAQKHHIKVKGKVEEDWFETYHRPPSKAQYVNALAKVVSEKDIDSELKEMPQVKKKRKRKTSDWDLF